MFINKVLFLFFSKVSGISEQMINRLAFVVDGTPDSSRCSEQLQLHDYGDSDECQIRIIADQLKSETVGFWEYINMFL